MVRLKFKTNSINRQNLRNLLQSKEIIDINHFFKIAEKYNLVFEDVTNSIAFIFYIRE